MPFGDIVVGSQTFQPSQPGVYIDSTTTYDGPLNELRFTGASPTRAVRATSSRYVLEKDVTSGDDVERRQALANIEIRVPKEGGFTVTELKDMLNTVTTAISEEILSRMLQGES